MLFEPITSKLSELQPINLVCVDTERPELIDEFNSICNEHHYLEHREPKGEKLRYIAYTNDNRALACLMFSHAAWNLPDRESFIGWSQDIKKKNLIYIANNSRFVIMQGVQVRNLATWVLGAATRRVSDDWESAYNHPILALETFVDESKHHGSCYKAANWTRVGELKIKKGQKTLIGSTLGVYLKSLGKSFDELKVRLCTS